MQEVFEKIIEKLKERCDIKHIGEEYVFPRIVSSATRDIYEKDFETIITIKEAIEIVKQAAKDFVPDTNVETNGWIPCSKELPPQPKENPIFDSKPLELYLVTEKYADYPIRAFWNGKFFTDGWSKVDVLAWQQLPQPYTKGE